LAILNRVSVTNHREVPYLHSGRVYEDPEVATWVSQPPPAYREETAQVVSYKVVEDSMISRDDVLFLQGSTQFADPRSYDVIAAMAEAMSDSSVLDQRFVVEGHASREGSYDANLALSQRRAERIVRDIVRYGISPDRLIPVGYGESEARAAADDPEYLRSQDRRVVVFRLDDQG
jgi:outer membrane protein OmpA-like peptidoglycan-associated protein